MSEEIKNEENVQEVQATSEENVYEMPAGYVDENGTVFRDFTLREMTGKDEEALQRADVRKNTSKASNLILSRCVLRIGAYTKQSLGGTAWDNLIKSLLVGDQDYMLLRLREVSMGSNKIEIDHVCPSCKAKLKTELTVDELPYTEFKGNRVIPFTLPRGYTDKNGECHKNGKMRLTNGLDREIILPVARINLAKAQTLAFVRICTFDDGYVVDNEVISSLTLKDRDYLQGILTDNQFGYQMRTEVTCDQCGETFDGSLDSLNFI